MRFRLFIYDDGRVDWIGVDTGKTTVVAHNPKRAIIALHIAGHSAQSGYRRIYGPAHYGVYEYKKVYAERDRIEIEIDELFGVLHWNVRGKK